MHQRDLYVVQVKQYCDSVNTFSSVYFHALRKSGAVSHQVEVSFDALLVEFSYFQGFKCIGLRDDSAEHLNSSYKCLVRQFRRQ